MVCVFSTCYKACVVIFVILAVESLFCNGLILQTSVPEVLKVYKCNICAENIRNPHQFAPFILSDKIATTNITFY